MIFHALMKSYLETLEDTEVDALELVETELETEVDTLDLDKKWKMLKWTIK